MSGVELARTALRSQPQLQVVFASGYGGGFTSQLDFAAVSMQKPYEIDQLRQVLASAAARVPTMQTPMIYCEPHHRAAQAPTARRAWVAKLDKEEEARMHSAAMRSANSVLLARQRAEHEMQEAREELRRSNERLKTVLESITDGFIVLDHDWTITYINPQAANIIHPLESGGQHALGQNLWEAFPELRGTVLEAQFRRAMEMQQSVGFELYYLPRQIWLDVRAYPSAE
eukprot:gene32730-36957_t